MEAYWLNRLQDPTGNSGTGRVAEVVAFDEGPVVVHWSTGSNALGVASTVVYASAEDMLKVHGHGGGTVLEPDLASGHMAHHIKDSTWTFRDGTRVWVTPRHVTIGPV